MPSDPPGDPYDAVVVAGGRSRRMGGVDKTALDVGGVPLLDRVLGAVDDARRVVVVGPRRPTAREVTWLQEDPPGTGPAAAVAVGLTAVTSDVVVLLAADLPFVDARTVAALRAATTPRTGAVVVDGTGREQPLLSCWPTARVRTAALGQDLAGAPLRALLGGIDTVRVAAPDDRAWRDCDTPDDLHWAREHA